MRRREATKILCDMKYLINTIQQRLEEKDIRLLPNEDVTQRKINNMFAAINDTFLIKERDVQKSWLTVVRDLREESRKLAKLAQIATTKEKEESSDEDEYY
jgi:hypothetical protein